MYDLNDLLKEEHSPREVQDILNTLEYDFDRIEINIHGDPIWYSPKKALERGKAICIEGAMIASALLGTEDILCMNLGRSKLKRDNEKNKNNQVFLLHQNRDDMIAMKAMLDAK